MSINKEVCSKSNRNHCQTSCALFSFFLSARASITSSQPTVGYSAPVRLSFPVKLQEWNHSQCQRFHEHTVKPFERWPHAGGQQLTSQSLRMTWIIDDVVDAVFFEREVNLPESSSKFSLKAGTTTSKNLARIYRRNFDPYFLNIDESLAYGYDSVA